MRTVLNHTLVMDTVAILGAAPPSQLSLSMLSPGRAATVVSVGCGGAPSALEQRLLELGLSGERVEVLAEARPGRDPFVVRVGSTTLALRRREVETVWVEP
jgi:Fe2+ transport system protein FeoA